MSNPKELALVVKAVKCGITGCCEWDDHESLRIRGDTNLQGLTPEYIRSLLIQFVQDGGIIKQVRERRAQYRHRDYYYKAIVAEPGFKFGLFVEMELTDPDADLPCVTILNAHHQSK